MVEELKVIANACYAHFNSSYLICKYIELREKYNQNHDEKIRIDILDILDKEQKNTLLLYKAQSQNPCIGFEASDIIYDMKYDAKHSFEDKIMPIEEAYGIYSDKIALLGGIDLDFVCVGQAPTR